MKNLLFIIGFCIVSNAYSQSTAPFWADIQKFKKQDSAKAAFKNAILLVGSSSFTRWNNVVDDFPGYPIINRGFGGSSLTDVIRYTYDVILPYKPKQVIIYCGENDLAGGVPTEEVVLRFKTLFGMIRQNLPATIIHFVSLKPSPSRLHLSKQMIAVNTSISAFLRKKKHAGFINVYDAMLDKDGQPKAEIFVADRLHMNEAGYAIWKKILLPYLIK